MGQSFSEKVKDPSYYPVLYEMLPPPGNGNHSASQAFLKVLDKIFHNVRIDAINIPEIHEEKGQSGQKEVQTFDKAVPRQFAREILKHRKDFEVIINHVVVHQPPEIFHQWAAETYDEFGLKNLILVGGESPKIKYPGPTVTEAAEYLRDKYVSGVKDNKCALLGGITIPTRRHAQVEQDEPARLVKKSQSGIEFFTSQVIYEAETTKSLLSAYNTYCHKAGVKPKRIFISFAPVSTPKDIKFLRWLGVSIPEEVEQHLLEGWVGMGWRSVELCQEILSDILNHIRKFKLKVPIGINVEHIMKYNVELSKELLVNLSETLK
ncbi:MAG: hypothetical protein WCV50_04130 [Patescibacteria group bacterium]|jgi:5,10-methylenetetrahydrofolate reductase